MRPQNLSYYVEVYAAVERIVLRSGCGAATVRAVAAEGGLSASTVRYYYRNQSHLLACAFAAVDDHFSHELGRHPFAPGRLGRGDKPRVEDAVDVLAVHLPTDGAGLERLRLLHAYKAWGRHDWDMAVTVGGFDRRLLDLSHRVLVGLGLPTPHAQRQARILRAVVTGLAEEVVTLAGPPEGEPAMRLPDRFTDRGVRAALIQHLRAVLTEHPQVVPDPADPADPAAPSYDDQCREDQPVDRAG